MVTYSKWHTYNNEYICKTWFSEEKKIQRKNSLKQLGAEQGQRSKNIKDFIWFYCIWKKISVMHFIARATTKEATIIASTISVWRLMTYGISSSKGQDVYNNFQKRAIKFKIVGTKFKTWTIKFKSRIRVTNSNRKIPNPIS